MALLQRRGFWMCGMTLLVALAGSAAAATPTALNCTNTSSGKQWTLPVDFTKSTVDRKPASITDSQITWSDTDTGPNYSFDRNSGVLTKTVASSTGAGVLFDQCQLK